MTTTTEQRKPFIVMMLPNHAPFGVDWARAARRTSRVVTLEIVSSLTLPEIEPGVAGDGTNYQVLKFSLRPSRLMLPVASRIQASRVQHALDLIARKHGRVDLLHTHYYHNTRILRHLRRGTRYVHTEHSLAMIAEDLGPSAHHRLSPTGRRMAERGFADAERVIAVSNYLKDCIDRQFDTDVTVIANPIDAELFEPNDDREPFQVVAVGRFSPDKRPDVLLNAFAAAWKEEPRLKLNWLGAGSELTSTTERARHLGLDGAITFLGKVDRTIVAHHVNRAGIFLNAAEGETFGVAIAEALVAGVPVVAPNIGAVRELVNPNNGLLVPDDGPEPLAQGLLASLSARYDRTEISEQAARLYSYDAVADKLGRLYRDVLRIPEASDE